MSQIFADDCIRKIAMLEKIVGTKTTYEVLPPFTLNPNDPIALQAAARKIAEFVGLRDITFIVASAKQEDNVGGHIELEHGVSTSYVEISKEMKKFHTAVLATLAHEITHKYLQVNGISCGAGPFYQYENEILTDITTVFLGLGKLMLNGCECHNVRKEKDPGGTRVITETMKTGYLGRSQLALVYRLVSAMRRIPAKACELGLSSEAIQALRECEAQYGYYFDDRFNDPSAKNQLAEKANSSICATQSILSNIDKGLSYLQCGCINQTEVFLEKTHKRLMEIVSESRKIASDNEYDPCLAFLNTMQVDQKIATLIAETKELASQAARYESNIEQMANLVQTLGDPFLQPRLDMFNTAICRNDGTKLRLPEGKPDLIAKCPKCRYEFVADTSIPAYNESPRTSKTLESKNSSGRVFRRK